jgi:hypothetical protein
VIKNAGQSFHDCPAYFLVIIEGGVYGTGNESTHSTLK